MSTSMQAQMMLYAGRPLKLERDRQDEHGHSPGSSGFARGAWAAFRALGCWCRWQRTASGTHSDARSSGWRRLSQAVGRAGHGEPVQTHVTTGDFRLRDAILGHDLVCEPFF